MGDIYAVKFMREYADQAVCKDCGKTHKAQKNNFRLKVCGLCYLNYEDKADSFGYVEEQCHCTGIEEDGHHIHRPITIQLLGKLKR
jgi:hypothetical protein